METRKLVVRRDTRGQLCLHDAETGQMISAQASLQIDQQPDAPTMVIVRLFADPRMRGAVRIEAEKEGNSEVVDLFVSDLMGRKDG